MRPVTTMNGIDSTVRIGLTAKLTSVKTAAAMNSANAASRHTRSTSGSMPIPAKSTGCGGW